MLKPCRIHLSVFVCSLSLFLSLYIYICVCVCVYVCVKLNRDSWTTKCELSRKTVLCDLIHITGPSQIAAQNESAHQSFYDD